jgi:hypothetical protein
MKKPKIYDNYPLWIVILANILMLAVYVAGAYIMFALSLITGFLYVAYLVLLELNYLKEGCTCCCYYGKLCAFGKGAIAAVFFKKEDPETFCERELSFKDMENLHAGIASRAVSVVRLLSSLQRRKRVIRMNKEVEKNRGGPTHSFTFHSCTASNLLIHSFNLL